MKFAKGSYSWILTPIILTILFIYLNFVFTLYSTYLSFITIIFIIITILLTIFFRDPIRKRTDYSNQFTVGLNFLQYSGISSMGGLSRPTIFNISGWYWFSTRLYWMISSKRLLFNSTKPDLFWRLIKVFKMAKDILPKALVSWLRWIRRSKSTCAMTSRPHFS